VAKNYYVILGVDPDASPDQIRSAYRRKAKELHPDHYEGSSSKPFRDVQEAYEALSDPERRECYDAECARERDARVSPWHARAEPLRPRSCPVEPLIPNRPPAGFGSPTPGWPLDDLFRDRRSGPSDLADYLWEEMGRWDWPTTQALDHEGVTIWLSPAQAQRGGRARIWIALQARCPICQGDGRVGFYRCWDCLGEGAIVEQRPVWIAFPAGVSDGSVARVSLAQLGMPDVYLVVRFRVREG